MGTIFLVIVQSITISSSPFPLPSFPFFFLLPFLPPHSLFSPFFLSLLFCFLFFLFPFLLLYFSLFLSSLSFILLVSSLFFFLHLLDFLLSFSHSHPPPPPPPTLSPISCPPPGLPPTPTIPLKNPGENTATLNYIALCGVFVV